MIYMSLKATSIHHLWIIVQTSWHGYVAGSVAASIQKYVNISSKKFDFENFLNRRETGKQSSCIALKQEDGDLKRLE